MYVTVIDGRGLRGPREGRKGRELTAQEGTLVEGWARTAAARARMAVVYFIARRGVWAVFDEARRQFGDAGGSVR